MNRYDAVIFDMDGLLLDTEQIALNTFMETCRYFGLRDETRLFMRLIGTNQTLGKALISQGLKDKVDVDRFCARWDERYHAETTRKPIPVKEGANDLLEHLRSAGIPAAVATSTDAKQALKKLEQAGLLAFFSLIVGGDEVSRGKPDPEIYLTAVARLGVEPRRGLALEDSENGVISAHEAGLTVIQIPDLVEPSASLRQRGHMVLPSLNDVIPRICC